MAKKLDDFPDDLPVRSTPGYPWDDWLNGSPWELRKGEDYMIKTKSFITNAQGHARTRGGRLVTALLPDDVGVVIQYRPGALGERQSTNPPISLVRTWAKANGWPDVAPSGNLPAEIVAAYVAANP